LHAVAVMTGLPTGTVTLLFTDIERSTQLARRLGDRYGDVLEEHRRVLREAYTRHDGVEVDTQGDASFAAFGRAHDAVAAAADAQRGLAGAELAIRVGVHTGEPLLADGGYYVGVDLSRAARICAAAHGGQVLLSRPTYDLVDGDVDVRDLGEHLLKDIESPERLLQLVAPGLRDLFPPPRAWAPGNLPRTRTRFFGRERELEDIRRLLASDAPVVTLTGPGGVGKTRLALEVARELKDDFTDGAFFISLAATHASDVPAALAQTLDVTEQAGETVFDALARYLESSSLLLVLDNFESALTAAPQIAALVDRCPLVKVLATSRERLHLGAELEYRLDTLTDSDATDLFTARAVGARPDLDVAAEADVVSAICKQLDRLPLALELAAARVRILPLRAILERLSERLAFLTGGARDLPERHRTLAATIDWSYTLLDEEEQSAFLSLAVFVGGASLEAIESVAATPARALELVTSLCDKSLLLSRTADDGAPRFAMLATIREFALARLAEQGRETDVRRRHAHYFRDFAEREEHEIQGHQQARVLQQLSVEHGNLRAALEWAAEAGEDETLARLAAALWRFWFARGHLSEGRTWLGRAVAVGDDAETRARALRGASVLTAVAGDLDEARRLANELVAARRELGSDAGIASALVVLANIEADLGEQEAAASLYEEAAARARQAGARPSLAGIMSNLGYLALLRDDPAAARTTCREAAALFEELGFGEEAAGAWLNAAAAELLLGELDEARTAFARSLDRYVDLQHAEGVSYCLDTAAAIAAHGGEARRAAVLSGAAAAARGRTGGTLPPLERRLRDQTTATVEAALGPEAFVAALDEGTALEPQVAVALARG
jgi:predicted ATPase/class 3 adenylate cyclase